ncbi:MAG: DUF4160 domain-containing protein [Armatimonadetes bacterium]|nr:DUF4160 domain-containing protein [Armatimonadota bacterium]MDE2205825.1 DUF4160 domain-containing protein [Armatimonadota bacterium]
MVEDTELFKEWSVPVDDDLTAELSRDFEIGPLLENGKRRIEERLVDRIDGLKIEIFSREHPPPHFRVSYQGESNNFDICTGEPLHGTTLSKWFHNIRRWHGRNRERLVVVWNDRRPSDCPVGTVDC